ncbi:hypothetical protein Leryth_014206 [Lithospermum erythrorhizon]|nr:hypothetical protein Leryth_014206 [Lithospermum erythrorhizon]
MSNALIGFICEDEPPKFTSRRESLIERLKEFGECQVGLLRDGFYALFFSSDGPGDECKTKVLEHGQLFINNRPLILRRWTQQLSCMVPSQFLKSFPVWIKIHNLDLEYWSSDSLSVISSMIGNPVSMDKFTASIIRDPQSILKKCDSTSGRHLDIARVRVEIDPHSVLPDTVNVSVEGKLVSVRVEYEWKPQPCTHCRSLYHDSNSCNIDRGDVHSHPQDLQSQERSVQDPGILYKPVLVEELESFEPNLGNTTMPSPHSSDDDIPGLISDNDEVDEDDDGIIVPGESGRQSTELSIPESLNDALRGDVREVESTRLRKLLSRIISRVFSSRSQHLHRSITL